MKKAKLLRIEQNQTCTKGLLLIDGIYTCMTLELPWRDNHMNVSCIPEGTYTCRRILSNHFGDTYEVCDVKYRSHILFHAGNKPADTEGCILTGESLAPGLPYIRSSKVALARLFAALEDVDEFQLEVTRI